MLGSSHLDLSTGAFALMVIGAGALTAVLAFLAISAFRRAGASGMSGALWGGGLVLAGALFGMLVVDRSPGRDTAAERRALENRAADLTARAIAPGSALACLDTVASAVVETACDKSVFGSPEAVASAIAYVDARLSLLGASLALNDRDPRFQSSLERLRRSLEADRLGLVAHVLSTRGCATAECPELAVFRDSTRVLANMKAHTFETSLGVHALAWPANAGLPNAVAGTPSSPGAGSSPTTALTGVSPMTPPSPATAAATPGSDKFDYPSASSIPPVSIMSAEPETPPPAPKPAAAPSKPAAPAQKRPASRQTAKDGASTPAPARRPAAAPAPPMNVAPQTPPPPQAPAASSQTSGAR